MTFLVLWCSGSGTCKNREYVVAIFIASFPSTIWTRIIFQAKWLIKGIITHIYKSVNSVIHWLEWFEVNKTDHQATIKHFTTMRIDCRSMGRKSLKFRPWWHQAEWIINCFVVVSDMKAQRRTIMQLVRCWVSFINISLLSLLLD